MGLADGDSRKSGNPPSGSGNVGTQRAATYELNERLGWTRGVWHWLHRVTACGDGDAISVSGGQLHNSGDLFGAARSVRFLDCGRIRSRPGAWLGAWQDAHCSLQGFGAGVWLVAKSMAAVVLQRS